MACPDSISWLSSTLIDGRTIFTMMMMIIYRMIIIYMMMMKLS